MLAIKLNRARLVVCLVGSLYIHNIRDMKVVHTIRDTPPNPNGLCALAPSSDNCYLAYPGSATVGEVQIFDAVNLRAKIMIPAHDSPLAAIAFSISGLEVATASEKGTVIRVFSVGPSLSFSTTLMSGYIYLGVLVLCDFWVFFSLFWPLSG